MEAAASPLLSRCFSCCCKEVDDDDEATYQVSMNLNCCASHNITNYSVTDGPDEATAIEENRPNAEGNLLQCETPSRVRKRSKPAKSIRVGKKDGRGVAKKSTDVHAS